MPGPCMGAACLQSLPAGSQKAGSGETKSQSKKEMEALDGEASPTYQGPLWGLVKNMVTQQCNTSPSQVPGDDR